MQLLCWSLPPPSNNQIITAAKPKTRRVVHNFRSPTQKKTQHSLAPPPPPKQNEDLGTNVSRIWTCWWINHKTEQLQKPTVLVAAACVGVAGCAVSGRPCTLPLSTKLLSETERVTRSNYKTVSVLDTFLKSGGRRWRLTPGDHFTLGPVSLCPIHSFTSCESCD